MKLNRKGFSYRYLPPHLNPGGGEQFTPAFRDAHPARQIDAE
jgi:hypothetical protein